MISVDVWLDSAITHQRSSLNHIRICNVGGTRTRGNYKYVIRDKAGRLWRWGHVRNFARTKRLAADLLYLVLQDAVGTRA